MFKVSSRLFYTDSFQGQVKLQGQLDYEKSNLYVLLLCALNPYTNEIYDTRNIACISISVIVEDVQDMPPVIWAPPVTRITSNHREGDELVVIKAVDGDRMLNRPIRFSIIASWSLYAKYFAINPITGAISLEDTVNSLIEAMTTLEPILVNVTAQELRDSDTLVPEEMYTSHVEIAFVIMDSDMMIPKFVHEMYVGEVRENSPPDTVISFPVPFLKKGVRGMFALEIKGDEGIFAVEPNVVRDSTAFIIKVKNPQLLDYETMSKIEFKLLARQVSGSAQGTGTTSIRINILDVNDNMPVFTRQLYQAEIFENITAGTSIVKVQATDADRGDFGSIRYTSLTGKLADRLQLDPLSGLVTCATNSHDFDRELNPEVQLTVEARDDNGVGNSATARILLHLKDINDKPPRFLEAIYTGVMTPDRASLKSPLRVQAVDDDAEEPNNQVVYSIDSGLFSQNFRVDRTSGEISVVQGLSYPQVAGLNTGRSERAFGNDEVIKFTVTASDQGTPQLSKSVPVQIFTQEFVDRFITFIYPKPPVEVGASKREIENQLETLTGGITEIKEIKAYSVADDTRSSLDKSVVTALVRYEVNTVVDVEKISKQLLNTTRPLVNDPRPVEYEELTSERNSYLAGVVVLCVFMAIIIILLLLCCFCPGCPLYKDRKKMKMVGDENAERVSYIRVDDRGGYRDGQPEERMWWEYLPNCCLDIAANCGFNRPPKRVSSNNGGRLAWSGDERQRYWQFGERGEGSMLEDRMMPRRGPRDLVLLEDLDEARLQQQGRMVRVDSRTSHRSQEPRRVFVLRDQRGNPRITESLREGEHYVMEDVDDTPRNMRMEDPRGMRYEDARGMRMDDPRGMRIEDQRGPLPQHGVDDDVTYARQGNAEVLRLHASPRGAVPLDDGATGRHSRPTYRRAGVEPEGIVLTQEEMQRRALMHEDAGGGPMSARLVEGQSVGVTPRSEDLLLYEGSRGYDHGSRRHHMESPPHTDVQIQTEDLANGRQEQSVPRLRIKTPIEEETNSLLEAEGIRSSRREKYQRERRRSQGNIEPQVHEDNASRKSLKVAQPANSLYHHTKASILRFESNKAKMDDEKDGKKEATTSRRNSISGTDGRRSSSVDSKGTESRRSYSHSNLDGRRSNSQAALDGRRSNSQANLEIPRGGMNDSRASVERRGSLPGLETTTGLEREAAQRSHGRRDSLGGQDRPDEAMHADGKSTHSSDYEEESGEEKDYKSTRRRQRKASQSRYMEWYDRGRDSKARDPKDSRARDSKEPRESRNRSVDRSYRDSDSKAELTEGHSRASTELRGGADSKSLSRIPRPQGASSSNLPDDLKVQEGEEELRYMMDREINLGVSQSQMFEGDADLEVAAAARGRRKRNHLLEKKSIFTIAYDDMQTDTLRPNSAAAEP
ncbi:uncharacterized protein [Penaeus vannamei]|uniref:uncharacterized protein isoform X2 n=1 Tax=Penaeus vannamei TaxID=6689 RepID=UPI00387FABB6